MIPSSLVSASGIVLEAQLALPSRFHSRFPRRRQRLALRRVVRGPSHDDDLRTPPPLAAVDGPPGRSAVRVPLPRFRVRPRRRALVGAMLAFAPRRSVSFGRRSRSSPAMTTATARTSPGAVRAPSRGTRAPSRAPGRAVASIPNPGPRPRPCPIETAPRPCPRIRRRSSGPTRAPVRSTSAPSRDPFWPRPSPRA